MKWSPARLASGWVWSGVEPLVKGDSTPTTRLQIVQSKVHNTRGRRDLPSHQQFSDTRFASERIRNESPHVGNRDIESHPR